MSGAVPYRKPTLHSEQQRAERFAARAALAEAKVAAVLALLDSTDAATVSTRDVRDVIKKARPAYGTDCSRSS